MQKLLFPVIVTGLLCGLAGSAYLCALQFAEQLLGPDGKFASQHFFVLLITGVAISIVSRLLGKPGDINILFDNIHVKGGEAKIDHLKSLLPVSLLCIASGGAMGPEAPLVQSTGGIGTTFGHRLGWSNPRIRILTLSGMSAGFAILFGTPFGAAIFALEIIHRRGIQYQEALIPSVVGAIVGYYTAIVLGVIPRTPVWAVQIWPLKTQWADIFVSVTMGVLGALIGALFIFVTAIARKAFSYFQYGHRVVLGGLLLAFLGVFSPFALTYGEYQARDLLVTNLTLREYIVAGTAKLLGAAVTLSSGWKGGFIIPLFFIGLAFGKALLLLNPQIDTTATLLTALMAATNSAVTKTPLGSALVVCGMMSSSSLPTTVLASVIAWLISDRWSLFWGQRDFVL